ncbi:MAG: D-aminoacylase [Rhodospirillaceae bacterium]
MAHFDLLIIGADVIDGTGGPRHKADVAVRGDRIARVADLGWIDASDAAETVDATGLALAPGFIDAHTHDDRLVLIEPAVTPKISQGVTTVIAGNCGVSLAPFDPAVRPGDASPPGPMALMGRMADYKFPTLAAYNDAFEASPPALNLAMLVGHTTLRAGVMDDFNRPATKREIDAMARTLDQSLSSGGIGLSTGLAYPTAIHAPTDEIVELAACLKHHGALYATHMRNEGEDLLPSVDETIDIATRTGAATVISHHKCVGHENWGKSTQSLGKIAEAQKRMKLDFDVYPYTATSTILLAEFLSTSEKTVLTSSEPHPEMAGRDFQSVVDEWGCSVDEAIRRLSPAGALYFRMDEAEVQKIMAFPGAMIGSDGIPAAPGARPHPRLWGTFPRVLGHYCRDHGVFPLEEAVHKMTGKTAAVFRLKDRGAIREGAFADLVLFNPMTVIDAATFDAPEQPARGIERVYVNGQLVWRDLAWTGARPGRRVRRETA